MIANLDKIKVRTLSSEVYLDELPLKQYDFRLNSWRIAWVSKQQHRVNRQKVEFDSYFEE